MGALYRAWCFVQENLIGTVAAMVLLFATVFACTEFFSRYMIGHTFHWGQDMVTHCIIAAVFLYFGGSQAKRSHLTVSILPDWLRGRGLRPAASAIRAFACLVVVVFAFAFAYYGLPGAERTWRTGRMTESMLIPLWPFQYALVIGMVALGITALFQFYQELMRVFGREVYSWDIEDEEFEL
jgi:TRAP-type C4-dicarboxylate transport system permease small subunit